MYRNLFTLVVILLLAYQSIHAHARTEIGFRFTEEEQKTYLEIHLTSLTLFDLLHHLYPELKSRESLNLGHYTADYEAYFNQILDLELNGEEQKLEYVESNLIIHDATIKFMIEDFNDSITGYHIAVSGFDFYQKPSFTFLFLTSSITDMCFLSKNENTCFGGSLEFADPGNRILYWLYWILAIVGLGLTILGVWKKKIKIGWLRHLSLVKVWG